MQQLLLHVLVHSVDPEVIAEGNGADFPYKSLGFYGRAAYFTATTAYVDSGCVVQGLRSAPPPREFCERQPTPRRTTPCGLHPMAGTRTLIHLTPLLPSSSWPGSLLDGCRCDAGTQMACFALLQVSSVSPTHSSIHAQATLVTAWKPEATTTGPVLPCRVLKFEPTSWGIDALARNP